ncbi:hypothetical protein Tco_1390582, partial [Tanacetum coccineum]
IDIEDAYAINAKFAGCSSSYSKLLNKL